MGWIVIAIIVVLIIADEWKSVGRDMERRNKLPYTPTVAVYVYNGVIHFYKEREVNIVFSDGREIKVSGSIGEDVAIGDCSYIEDLDTGDILYKKEEVIV